ncbi:MAG: histidinol-phosphate transaminase [Saprospiraceae bacterium]|nr:histidinol-phosphate transaminase [Saprospiraceae bacterium]
MNAHRKIKISLASNQDRQRIYEIRHRVYAVELGQHPTNENGTLSNQLDEGNIYFIAQLGTEIIGFISITPPGLGIYSMDKYLSREALPFEVDDTMYEMRILTVLEEYRKSPAALLLMWAAYRWIDTHKGTNVMAIGKLDVLPLYLKLGFKALGIQVEWGAVRFELIHGNIQTLHHYVDKHLVPLFRRLEANCDWDLNISFFKPGECYHGGAFFNAIGNTFDNLTKRHDIINADVLDAWFPPSPRIMDKLNEHLPWIARTSPPTDCGGMTQVIANKRGVKTENILPGAGSSDLIFLAFREWLTTSSRVLILDPMYGEYSHVLEKLIRCEVDLLALNPDINYQVNLEELKLAAKKKYDLIVLVNPNSPTGQHVDKEAMIATIKSFPSTTRVWVDETYVEYAGSDQSIEQFAAKTNNVIVCKSMSKVYALSGLRSAYLCASAYQLENLQCITPPWAVSLPAQIAAVIALQDEAYYREKYKETHFLREQMIMELSKLDLLSIVNTTTNFVLCHLKEDGPTAAELVSECRKVGVYLRDVGTMGKQFGKYTIRIAIKDSQTNQKILQTLSSVLISSSVNHSS